MWQGRPTLTHRYLRSAEAVFLSSFISSCIWIHRVVRCRPARKCRSTGRPTFSGTVIKTRIIRNSFGSRRGVFQRPRHHPDPKINVAVRKLASFLLQKLTLPFSKSYFYCEIDICGNWHLQNWHLRNWHLQNWYLRNWHLRNWHLRYILLQKHFNP